VRFKRSVAIIPSDEGLHLKVTGLFQRIAKTKPAAIPWNELKVATEKKMNWISLMMPISFASMSTGKAGRKRWSK